MTDPFTVNVWIILFGALATYATRFGGHVVLSRFEKIHPRVEAALNAVPAAVLTTLVAPAAVFNGPAEAITMALALIVGWRAPMLVVVFLGAATVALLRSLIG
ncbi:AzlD family protein [Pararhizobium haloflavum]|uniref:AzlD family protein n=1 Tax=Pararhizobium haloflavum TaxID=2037914 RepID=UPI000C1745DD|nr:AzlD family protein [Pararhizobium haloflavum]